MVVVMNVNIKSIYIHKMKDIINTTNNTSPKEKTKKGEYMAGIIIKQPNGLYCRFSTVVDCPTNWNMTFKDYVNLLVEKNGYSKAEGIKEANEIINDYLHDFDETIERYIPHNMSIDEFNKVLKEMGYDKEYK